MKFVNFIKKNKFRRTYPRSSIVYTKKDLREQNPTKFELSMFWKQAKSSEVFHFLFELYIYIVKGLRHFFIKFEISKTLFATALYRQRGKNAKRFVHSSMAALAAFGVMIAPVVAKEFPGSNVDPWEVPSGTAVLSATSSDPETTTDISAKPRDKIVDYEIQTGDTISSIAEKFGVSIDTVLWENGLTQTSKIKPGQTLKILSVTGVSHKVQKGDTVYSIAKKYDASPQAIVDFPYNTFVNDETFELAIGDVIIVPDGVKPNVQPIAPRLGSVMTPNAGAVTALGVFVWPTNGTISQRFSWYHPGVDIANRALPNVLAADAGTVVFAGWDGAGYGNMIMIDHGNGYKTRYAHLSKIYVVVGQTVNRGAAIGRMGSTGHSTGPHLHFEIYSGGTRINPLSALQ
jgi:LysM repeat protein